MIEKDNRSTMGIDPLKRLDQIRNVITMLEYFEGASNSHDTKSNQASEEVRDAVGTGSHECRPLCLIPGPSHSPYYQMMNAHTSGVLRSCFEDYRSKLLSLLVDTSAEEMRLDSLEGSIRNRYG